MNKSTTFLILWIFSAQLLLGQQVALSDEFESPCSLYDWTDISDYEGWNATHLEVKDVNITNAGQLTMMPLTTSWYANYRSTLLFKEVTGDFTFTTNVTASNRAETGMPGRLYSLAGLMIRTPRDTLAAINNWQTGMANYVFMALGFAATNHPSCSGCPGPHFEVKSTTNSNSNLRVASISGLEAEIRMVRVNDAILVLYKTPGNDYVVHQRYFRPDMPETVQIGFVTYTDWPNVSGQNVYTHNSTNQSFQPDLIGKFDYGRVQEVNLPAGLADSNFHIAESVSDATILQEFGYDSEYSGRVGWKVWKGTVSNDWGTAANWSNGLLPTSSDSILIPNCQCPEVQFPMIDNAVVNCQSLVIDEGGSLSIASSGELEVDLSGSAAFISNAGVIVNEGILTATNMMNKSIENTGYIQCEGSGICNF